MVTSVFCVTLSELEAKIAGWFGLIFFGLVLTVVLARSLHRGVALRISSSGLTDYRAGLTIPWEEIRHVWVYEVAGNRFLSLDVDRPERFVQAGWRKPLRRALTAFNKLVAFAPIVISFNELTPDVTEAARYINALDVVSGYPPRK